MSYEVGTKVRIRTDLVVREHYGDDVFVSGMVQYKGLVATIKYTHLFGNGYVIDLDNGRFHWTDEMLEPVSLEELKEFLKKLK